MPAPKIDVLNGILLVNKPSGLTSHDVVDRVRRQFQIKKVGHAGTLDPMATGLLVLAVGKATKLTAKLITDKKSYSATCLLGVETDTQDIQGNVLREQDASNLELKQVESVVMSFLGQQYQIPPMYSAKKQNGKKLYELARKGIEVEREPKEICIYELKILKWALPRIEFYVSCSKGTYIRTLCHDIGKKLTCGGTLETLSRIRSGAFDLEQAVSLEDIMKLNIKDFQSLLIPISEISSNAYTKTV